MKDTSYGIIVFAKDVQWEYKVLLVHHNSGGHRWFPKGHKNKREGDIDAAIRETQEETSVHVSETDLLGVELTETYQCESSHHPGKVIDKTVVYFLASLSQVVWELVSQEWEIKQCGWYDLSTASVLLTYDESKNLLNEAQKYIH